MCKVAIVDDEEKIRNRLKEYFARYEEENQKKIQITEYADAEQFLTGYKPVFDLILMDIDMPYINGMEAARRLRKMDEKVVLMFVTNLAQYAIHGYEVSAVDFVVKPVSYTKFTFKITRALKMIPKEETPAILLHTEEGIVKVPQNEITYVEIDGHSLFFHTAKDIYRIRGSMKQAVDELDTKQFFLCNKCYLVNLAHVEKVNGYDVTIGEDIITVSRPKKKEFMNALAAYR